MKRKGVLFFIIVSFLLVACKSNEEKVTVTIYVRENSENWISKINDEGIIEEKRIEMINEELEKSGKNYQVQFHWSPVDESVKNVVKNEINSMETMRKERADIILFNQNVPLIKYFESLNKYLKQENGVKLRKEIPDHIFKANEISNTLYYIPKIVLPYQQFYISFEPNFYNTNKSLIDENTNDVTTLLEELINTYEMKENEILFNSTAIVDKILWKDYANITGTPLLIRRSDKKIVNPLEEKEVMKMYQLLIKANLKGFTGKNFSQDEWDKFYETGEEVVYFSENYVDEKDTHALVEEKKRIEIVNEDRVPVVSSGYGISKNSSHKKEAFDFLCEMNANPKIANLLVYGKDLQSNHKNETGKNFFGGLFKGILGNDIITDQNVDQKENKREIIFKSDKKSDLKLIAPYLFDLSKENTKIDEINNVWNDFSSITSNYMNLQPKYETLEEAMTLFAEENKKLKEIGIDEIIDKFQKELAKRD